MQVFKLALRNLTRQKKRSFLLGGAIAFGIMIVTVINGFAASFVANVSENFANLAAGHIFVEGIEKSASGRENNIVRDDQVLIAAAQKAGIPAKYVTKRSAFTGTLINEGNTAELSISGVNFAEETFLPDRLVFKKGSLKGMEDRQGIILSEPIAKRLAVEPGDHVLAQLKTYTGQQNVGEFVVAGITFDSGILGNTSAYANKAYVNELLNLGPDEYQTLGFYLPSLKGMDKYGTDLYSALKGKVQLFDRKAAAGAENPVVTMMQQSKKESWSGIRYRVFTLNDMLAQVQQIVNVLNTVSLVILIVLFVIIMVGISNTFRIIMFERIREIGTMRSMGMQRGEVKNLFLFEALFLALGGAVAGLLLAGIVMGILSLVNFGLNSPVFIILKNGHLSFRLEFWRNALDVAIVAVLTLVAAYVPARNAAKMDPAVALRTVK
jgi:putative ABC transport system permease protein